MTHRAASPEQTQALAERLGRVLKPGDVVGLVGGLGAGKTTFAQGMAVGLGVDAARHVASPTFSLVNEHLGRIPFVHADLYRLTDSSQLAELGLEDCFDRAAVAIEWSDRFAGLLPVDHLLVRLVRGDGADQQRDVTLEASGPRAREILAALAGLT